MKCALGKLIPKQPATADELTEMKEKVWHRQGLLVVRPEQINDSWVRQILENVGNELYGKRGG